MARGWMRVTLLVLGRQPSLGWRAWRYYSSLIMIVDYIGGLVGPIKSDFVTFWFCFNPVHIFQLESDGRNDPVFPVFKPVRNKGVSVPVKVWYGINSLLWIPPWQRDKETTMTEGDERLRFLRFWEREIRFVFEIFEVLWESVWEVW